MCWNDNQQILAVSFKLQLLNMVWWQQIVCPFCICQADMCFCSLSFRKTGAVWDSQKSAPECRAVDTGDWPGHRRIQIETQGAQNTLPGRHWEDVWWEIMRYTPDYTFTSSLIGHLERTVSWGFTSMIHTHNYRHTDLFTSSSPSL